MQQGNATSNILPPWLRMQIQPINNIHVWKSDEIQSINDAPSGHSYGAYNAKMAKTKSKQMKDMFLGTI